MGRINLKITNKENFGKKNNKLDILDFKTYYEMICNFKNYSNTTRTNLQVVEQSPERDPNIFGE